MCIRMKTAWSSSAGDWSRKSVRSCCRRRPPPVRRCIGGRERTRATTPLPNRPAPRRAFLRGDHGCRRPGGGGWVGQGRRIRHWANGGPTTLANLTLLCRRHHRAVREGGYQVERGHDGALRFWRPDGRLLSESPALPAVPADPVGMLRARHNAQGLAIDPRTAMPGWLGERLDVGYAIDVLHPLAGSVRTPVEFETRRSRP